MLKKRSVFYILLSLFMIFGLSIVYDAKNPSCSQAQGCISISPRVIYGTTGSQRDQGCSNNGNTVLISVSYPGTQGVGFPLVALMGWQTDVDNDEDLREFDMRIIDPTVYSGNRVNFAIKGCYKDTDGDDWYNWQVWYVIVIWQ